MARPRAADLPRPRAAVRDTVLRRVFSEMASTNLSRHLAWSRVLEVRIKATILDILVKICFHTS